MLDERFAMEQKVIEKAWRDPEFKARLLSDPKAAIEAELGVAVPEGVTIKVLEEDASTGYLVLPQNPEDMELSDADLAAAAGGSHIGSSFGCATSYC